MERDCHMTVTYGTDIDSDTDGDRDMFVFLSVVRDQDVGEVCTADASGPWCRPDLDCGVCDSEDAVSICQIQKGGKKSNTCTKVV